MKRALISVTDKTHVVPFAEALIQKQYVLYSTGGTYTLLKEAGLACTLVEEITKFKEVFEGRLKTLHPLIHGGLLGKQDDESHQKEATENGIVWFELVVVNLYRFQAMIQEPNHTLETMIEHIDIGGVALLRSAAKNHRYVTVVSDIDDYDTVLSNMDQEGNISLNLRKKFAAKAFRVTAEYDAVIAAYLTEETFPERLTLTYRKQADLRYGENPHQQAALYKRGQHTVLESRQRHGKALSYNNIQDAQVGLSILKEFSLPCIVAIKHMNPCGIACAPTIHEAWQKAYQADPVSIFGGIIVLNQEVDAVLAKAMNAIFLELIIAPSFNDDALGILKQKKNLRLLETDLTQNDAQFEYKSVGNGLIIQESDRALYETLECMTETNVTEEDIKEMLFAYKVVKHVKSNAIVITKNYQTLGIGAGQMNRVGAAKIALEQAGESASGAYLASDAFFPMSDTVNLAAKYNIKGIIQPGGSIKDQESIDACNAYKIPMIFTSTRHFKH